MNSWSKHDSRFQGKLTCDFSDDSEDELCIKDCQQKLACLRSHRNLRQQQWVLGMAHYVELMGLLTKLRFL